MFSKVRKTLFWIFTTIYLVAAPFIIIMAFGYRLEYKEATFVETGIISIKSYPDKAEISLNNKLYGSKTPLWISGLIPGKYKINLSKEGYYSWTKTLDVNPRMVTKAEEILLLPTHVTSESIFRNREVLDFITSKNFKGVIALTRTPDNIMEFYLVLSNEPEPRVIFVKDSNFFDHEFTKNLKLESISKGNTYLLVSIPKGSLIDYYAIKIEDGQVIHINKNFFIKPSDVKWSESEDSVLYFIQDRYIGRIVLNEEKGFLSAFKCDSFGLVEDRIYLFDRAERSVSFTDKDLKDINVINKDDYLTNLLFTKSKSDSYKILMNSNFLNIFRDSVAVLLSSSGEMYLMRPFYYLDNSVKYAIFSGDGTRIVYYNGKKIIYYNLTIPEESKDMYFTPVPSKEDIYTPNRTVSDLFFFVDDNHILFNEGKNFIVTELDGREKRNYYTIYSRNIEDKFYFSDSDERMYFIDTEKSTSKKNLYKIDFYKNKRN